MKWCVAFISFLLVPYLISAQNNQLDKNLLKKNWSSFWISSRNDSGRVYAVYHFRKSFNINVKPSTFTIHVSADNRYSLFVNGQAVTSGPARGDLFNWYYETVDIAKYLRLGKNVIAAQVWNMGTLAAVAQVSNQTALVVQGDSPAEEIVNSDTTWKVLKNQAYKPCSLDNGKRLQAYMVVGPGDEVNGNQYPWNWQDSSYDDSLWDRAILITHPELAGHGTDNRWTLVPRNIPLFQERLEKFPAIRKTTGINLSKPTIIGQDP